MDPPHATPEDVPPQNAPSENAHSENAPCSTPPDAPKLNIHDTPVKLTSSSTLPFTTHSKFRIDAHETLAQEMKDYLVGPMPIDSFLDDFFPKLPGHIDQGTHKYPETVACHQETLAYIPFVSTCQY